MTRAPKMQPTIPLTMRSLCVQSYRPASELEVSSIPTPQITLPNHVLVKVHAASINPADMELARGEFKMAITLPFPVKLGFDVSGTVAAVGSGVAELKVGDEVFGCMKFGDIGTLSEYVLTTELYLIPKPRTLSHVEAAAIPLVALSALQALQKFEGELRGKTVLITAGLGGVGSVACQMAKNVFGAGKVITTVSTEKVGKLDIVLGTGVIDQIVDYKKSDVLTDIPHGSVDLMIDSTHSALHSLPLLSKPNGQIISIQGHQSGPDIKACIPEISSIIAFIMNLDYLIYKFRVQWWGGVKFDTMLQTPTREGMLSIAKWIEEGKLKSIVGRTVMLEDSEGLREVCIQLGGYRGFGKVVVEMF